MVIPKDRQPDSSSLHVLILTEICICPKFDHRKKNVYTIKFSMKCSRYDLKHCAILLSTLLFAFDIIMIYLCGRL